MGISPEAVVGTATGAIIGGAYAAGIDARAIRTEVLPSRVLPDRSDVMGKLLSARVGHFANLVLCCRSNPAL